MTNTFGTFNGAIGSSATASGVAYSPGGQYRSTAWYGVPNSSNIPTTAMTKNKVYLVPFTAFSAFHAKKVAIHVFTAHATTTVRLGIYHDTGHGKPSTLVVDFGTIATTTTGTKTKTVSVTLTAGYYWLASVQQTTGAGIKLSYLLTLNSTLRPILGIGLLTPMVLGSNTYAGWKSTTSVTGAYPTTIPGVLTAILTAAITCPPAIQLQSS